MSFARIAVRSVAIKAPLNVRAAVPAMAVRSIAVSSVMQKDVVQELFLKELKNYKPAPAAKVDDSQVKELKLPTPPAAPKVDEDLTEQLAKYDAEPEEVAH
ncbi:ATP synthase complex subunit H-domain-containing protein [Radiomyces spectabilis]|uniref:ATP synthase complex subunit H-domain-containing protein n=1 Tax=Radiomyces spectabilis TaxID=64574 RepID=UPI002220DC54|nr:ATP synthase complex subunit H-domain-containing protein [Radiomyces spectabilis]KAI8379142.1 ATP synthase complex subunit H-domain-containing protein [Radiomyces spectabilis]